MNIEFNPYVMVNIKTLGSGIKRADATRNYCIYNNMRVDVLSSYPDKSLPYIKEYLKTSNDENGILEALSIVDKIADDNIEKTGSAALSDIYPSLSRFNNTDSPDIQVMLSGIYRKILVPDAFGPLCKMLYKQIRYPNSKYFDPTEETGGAILEYLRSYAAQSVYGQNLAHTQT